MRNDIRILTISTVAGLGTQLLAKVFLKREERLGKPIKPRSVVRFLSNNGTIIGFFFGGGLVIKTIPTKLLRKSISKALPSSWIAPEEDKFFRAKDIRDAYFREMTTIYVHTCDRDMACLLEVLESKISFEEKQELLKLVNIFGIGIISLIFMFAIDDDSEFWSLIERILSAIRDGRISKRMAKFIINRLRKRGLPEDLLN